MTKDKGLIILTDPNKDIDDLINLIVATSLHKSGIINILGIITTLGSKKTITNKALYTKGILKYFGLDVPVCSGTEKDDFTDKEKISHNIFAMDSTVRRIIKSAKSDILNDAQKFLLDVFLKAKPHSIDLLVIAQMTDVSKFIKNNTKLFLKKINSINIQGGLDLDKYKQGIYYPDDSANNKDDLESSVYLYDFLGNNKISTTIMNRSGVYKIGFDKNFYKSIKETNGFLGKHIYGLLRKLFTNLVINCFDGDSLERQTPLWLIKTFMEIPGGKITAEEKKLIEIYERNKNNGKKNKVASVIFNKLSKFYLYDPLTLITLVKDYSKYFKDTKYGNFIYKEPENKLAIYNVFNEHCVEYLKRIKSDI